MMLVFQIFYVLPEKQWRGYTPTDIIHQNQVVISFVQEAAQGCHLTWASTNKHGLASLQGFTNSDIKSIETALKIFARAQTRQVGLIC